MTLISKLGISLFISAMSMFILHKPPAPTPADLAPAPITVWQALEPASPTPTANSTPSTPITPTNACGRVFAMGKHVGFDVEQLGMLVAIAQRESRCRPDAFNPRDPNGGSAGVMQINYFWCKPSQYWPRGYLQAHGLIRSCDDLFDLEHNLRSALAIYRYSDGWRTWRQ